MQPLVQVSLLDPLRGDLVKRVPDSQAAPTKETIWHPMQQELKHQW
jgi:hypothetical protein